MQRRKYKKHKRPGSTGKNHWNWSDKNTSIQSRENSAKTNCRLRYLCDLAQHFGFMSKNVKFMGRPPNSYIKLNLNSQDDLIYILLKIKL